MQHKRKPTARSSASAERVVEDRKLKLGAVHSDSKLSNQATNRHKLNQLVSQRKLLNCIVTSKLSACTVHACLLLEGLNFGAQKYGIDIRIGFRILSAVALCRLCLVKSACRVFVVSGSFRFFACVAHSFFFHSEQSTIVLQRSAVRILYDESRTALEQDGFLTNCSTVISRSWWSEQRFY